MEQRRWNHILALKTNQGQHLAFHSHNMQVAEITPELWSSINNPQDMDHEAFEQLQVWDQESGEAISENKPKKVQSLSINVTQICNLQCTYCAAGGDGTYGRPQKKISITKTIPQLDVLLARIEKNETFSITFLGGEPLLYPQGIELIAEYAQEIAEQKGFQLRMQVITNGTQFSDDNINLLKRYNMQVTVSLDGPSAINDKQRPTVGGLGSTEKIIQGIKKLTEQKKPEQRLKLQGVFGTHNTQIFDAYLFYRELKADSFEFNFDQTSSDSQASEKFVNEMEKVLAHAHANGGEHALRQIHFVEQIFQQLDDQYRIENYCGSGRSFAAIDANNAVFDCPWAANDLQSRIDQDLKFQPEQLQHLKTTLISTNNCTQCWAKHLCGGGCSWAHKQATGDKSRPDIIFCERTRSLISLAISYYYQVRKELS